MATDYIRYDILTQDALRGVVRTVLADAASKGLPGDHHFFISFDTRAEGVRMSQRLREQYPEEMTIVLQHQFWDLTIDDDVFDVGLSFNGVPERLTVPLAAIKGFFDPSVQFGLQFALASDANADEQGSAVPAPATIGTTTVDNRPPARKERQPAAASESLPTAAAPTPAKPDDTPPQGGGEVVRLDRFRKK